MATRLNHLFPLSVSQALNAIQYLRAMYILSKPHEEKIYSTSDQIAESIGASPDSIRRVLAILTGAEVIVSKMGAGYHVLPEALLTVTLIDIIRLFGLTVPDTVSNRASDRLNCLAIAAFDLPLETFFTN